jgi:ketopantoate reductase
LAAAGIGTADLGRESTVDLGAVAGVADWRRTSWHGSSTWQSLSRGVSLETDYLNGEIVLLGRLHGVATPVNAALQRASAHAAATHAPPAALGDDDLRTLIDIGG